MSGLKLGDDLVLDPRRAVFLPSLKVLVCAGLCDALDVGIAGGLRSVLERVDSVLSEYKPESMVIIGKFTESSALRGIVRRWGAKTKLLLVADELSADARMLAEGLSCEAHHELIWGNYRFIESGPENPLALPLFTLSGAPYYSIRVGRGPFGGMKLALFLKGPRRLFLPTLSPNASGTTVFDAALERYDVFAVGHHRVLPLGKALSLKSFKGLGAAYHSQNPLWLQVASPPKTLKTSWY